MAHYDWMKLIVAPFVLLFLLVAQSCPIRFIVAFNGLFMLILAQYCSFWIIVVCCCLLWPNMGHFVSLSLILGRYGSSRLIVCHCV